MIATTSVEDGTCPSRAADKSWAMTCRASKCRSKLALRFAKISRASPNHLLEPICQMALHRPIEPARLVGMWPLRPDYIP